MDSTVLSSLDAMTQAMEPRSDQRGGDGEGPGQGSQAALWLVRPGGLVVAGDVARFAASRPDTDVEEVG